jgi:hypothetical protein
MVIEPPGNLGRTGILEIDNGILVAIELVFVEQRAGAVQQTRVNELHITADAFAVKTGEQRGRASAVKTFVVIKDPYSQNWLPYPGYRFLRA